MGYYKTDILINVANVISNAKIMPIPKTLQQDLEIVQGHRPDYKLLGEYHYIKQEPTFVRKLYVIKAKQHCENIYPYPIGLMVYSPPFPNLKPRNTATNNFFNMNPSQSDRLKILNKQITYASRLIIDPRYRKLGLGTWLLKETLELQDYPIIETLSPIDFTNQMLIKLGFELHYNPAPVWYRLFIFEMESLCIWNNLFNHPKTVMYRINCLTKRKRIIAEDVFNRFVDHFQKRRSKPFSLEKVTYALTKIPYPEAYLIKRQ